MKRKHIVYGVVALSLIIGYNVLLIQRDKQLFDPVNQITQKERFCMHQGNWHPDCNVK
jgi:hypothetical protein